MSEKQITKKIIEALKTRGFFVWKQHGGPMGTAGLPDVFAIKGGKIFAFEVKKPGGKTSKLQVKRLDDLEKSGALVAVVFSVEEVLDFLERSQWTS